MRGENRNETSLFWRDGNIALVDMFLDRTVRFLRRDQRAYCILYFSKNFFAICFNRYVAGAVSDYF